MVEAVDGGRGTDGAGTARRHAFARGRPAYRDAQPGARGGGDARGVSGTGRSPPSSRAGSSTIPRNWTAISNPRCRTTRPSRSSPLPRNSASDSTSATVRWSIEDDGSKRYFNTAILVDREGQIAGKYRKVHIPGHAEPQPGQVHQHLEKRYFEPGDLGFPVFRSMDGVMGMCICNDRRWPETYRVMGLQGVELVMLGLQHAEHQSLRQGSGGAPSRHVPPTISPCRPAPIRTAPGWLPQPRPARRRAFTTWAEAASSRRPGRSWPWP